MDAVESASAVIEQSHIVQKNRRKIVNLFPDNSSPYAKNRTKTADGTGLRAEPYRGTVSGLLPLQYWVNDQQGGTEVGARAHENVA